MNTYLARPLRNATLSALAVVVPLAGGCSAFQPRTQRVTIIPSDPAAQVYLNNNPVGTGTTTLELERHGTYAVAARSGGSVGTRSIGRRVSGTGILDIVGGCLFLVPFVGCFTPGFWELDKTTVTVPVGTPPATTAHAAAE